MSLLLRCGFVMAPCLFCVRLLATTYYVDSRDGHDARSGTTRDQSWRSLERVNRTTFAPGDQVLLRAGSRWEGQSVRPLGCGTPEAPIVLGRYDDGPAPALHGRGQVPWVVSLQDQECWEIRDLEITNFTAGPRQRHRAVEIRVKDFGWARRIHLKNLSIHDVNAVSDYTNDGDTVAKSFEIGRAHV